MFKQNWRKGTENGFFETLAKFQVNLSPRELAFFFASGNLSQQPAKNSGARQVFDPVDEPKYG